MTITVPDQPRPGSTVEEKVLQLLVEQLGDRDLVVAGQRVTDHLKDHEVDFVVAIEGAGIVCVEVKGGEVWPDGTGWLQKSRGGHIKSIEPVRQAREACYALRTFVESDPRWTQGRVRWDHMVVLPFSDIPDDFALPECPRWKIIDRDELPSLATQLKAMLAEQQLATAPISTAGVEQLRTALGGRGLPQRDVVARALPPAARIRRPVLPIRRIALASNPESVG